MINKIFNKKNVILGIETSFDDTTSSVIRGNKILSNIIFTQKIHNKYNGVIPNLASKLHLKKIFDVVKKSINKLNFNIINGIAYTKGPGLISSLIIGESFAKSIALAYDLPLYGVNHIHGHIFANFLYKKNNKYPKFPFICLSVSGGHTNLILVKNFLTIKNIGATLDDSLGNLFDKFSNLLGLNFTKGPYIMEKLSYKGKNIFKFPIPKVKDLNFSFSGLKTFLTNFIKKNILLKKNFIKKNIHHLCKSFHETIFKILKNKINKTIKITKIKNIVITGGVSSNKYLIKKLYLYFKKKKKNFFYLKNKKLNKDNAAMIALIGQIKHYYKLNDNFNIKSNPRLGLEIL